MGSFLLGNEDQRNQFDLSHFGYILDEDGNPVNGSKQPNQALNTDTGQMVNYDPQTGLPIDSQIQPQTSLNQYATSGQPQPMGMQPQATPQQGGMMDFMNKPSPLQGNVTGMAGLLLASGVPYGQALMQASKMAEQQASSGNIQQKQQLIQMLGQTQDPNLAKRILYSGAFTPAEIESFTKLSGSNTDLINGANGLKYTQTKDPTTGEVALKLVPGQVEKPSITPAEARINNNQVTKLANSANAAAMENRYLDDAEKYFQQYDKATGTLTGAGGVIARNAPKQLDNLLLNKDAQSAKQAIDKVSGLIFQNRVIGAGSSASDAFKEQVKKSLPTVEITPDARKELIETKRRENMATLTRSKFISEWYKQNNKDIAGAEDAYDSYIGSTDLLDKDGQVNKQLLKDIPSVVTDFIGKSSQPLQDNRQVIGGGSGGDNTDARFADSTGQAGAGQSPMVAPQQKGNVAQNSAAQLQQWAQDAISKGADPKAVNARLAQLSGGR